MKAVELTALLVALFLIVTSPAAAGPYEDGLDAYNRADYANAVRLWRTSAAQGNALAQTSLGYMYEQGRGVPQDHVEAVRLYRLAVAKGLISAYYNLGNMFLNGWGVSQNNVEAARLIRIAADHGQPSAQLALGRMHYLGRGVPQDYAMAHMWFNLASATGNVEARQARDALATLMTPAQIVEAQRLAREWKPTPPR